MSFHNNGSYFFENLVTIQSGHDFENFELLSNDDVENVCADNDLYEFYLTVLHGLLDVKNKKNVRLFRLYCKLLRQLSDRFCRLDENASSDLRSSFFYLLSYLCRNGPIVSSAVAHFFEKSADLESNILNALLEKSEVSICSFGGFPADVVGIVHKLCYAAEGKGLDLSLNVAVIDLDDEWKDTCISTLLYLKPFRNHIGKIEFFLYYQNKKDLARVLKKADIISMAVFFSKPIERKIHIKIMQDVCELSKSGCMIFVLDFPIEYFVRLCGGYSGKWLHKYCISICDDIFGLHTLDGCVLKKHSHLFKDLCNGVLPNYYIKYFVRTWVKSTFTLPSNKELDFKRNKCDLKVWFEMNKINPILGEFRQELEKLKEEREHLKKMALELIERRDFRMSEKEGLAMGREKKNKQINELQNTQIKLSPLAKLMKLYKKSVKNAQLVEKEYRVSERKLLEQKLDQCFLKMSFNSTEHDIYKRAWKAYRDNKRAFVNEELQNYRCSIARLFK